jgi:hypothetical protein
VADSEALRARRYRAHQAGIHELCLPGRCKELGPDATQQKAAEATARLAAAVLEEFPEHDALSRALALRLVELSEGRGRPPCRRYERWASWWPPSGTRRDALAAAAPSRVD